MYMGETEKALADADECIKISPKWTKVCPFATCLWTCGAVGFFFLLSCPLPSIFLNETVLLMYVPDAYAYVLIQGYLRKGQALHKLKKYVEAMQAYSAGLKVNPSDKSLTSAAQGLRPYLQQQQQSMFSNLFSPQNIAMLKQHPQTAPLFADGSMEKKLSMVRGAV